MSDLIRGNLTAEAYREYEFKNGKQYRITAPVALFTRPGGTTLDSEYYPPHRIVKVKVTIYRDKVRGT